MQIDAHTDVVQVCSSWNVLLKNMFLANSFYCQQRKQDWDRKILDEWGSVDNEYAILTSYPTNVHDLGHNSNKHWEVSLCFDLFKQIIWRFFLC